MATFPVAGSRSQLSPAMTLRACDGFRNPRSLRSHIAGVLRKVGRDHLTLAQGS